MAVLGISFDAPDANRRFAAKFDFPFPLLSDPTRVVGLAYGACADPKASHAKRLTYVIGQDGLIEQAIDTTAPATQAADLLESM